VTSDTLKAAAAARALELIEPGMKLGLGTGSTAAKLVDMLGERVRGGLGVVAVPTSEATRAQAERAGIRLATLDEIPFLDLTIDGADELDAELRLIKGGGGALLREKIVAMASERMVVIADHTKQVETIGKFPLPVEVIAFGLKSTRNLIEVLARDAGCEGEIKLRLAASGQPFRTDSGHLILDCAFGAIPHAEALAHALEMIPGVVEHGLFLDIADLAIVAGPGGVEVIEAEGG
jgi:ribose 5-phosphate isomerase A